MSTQENDDLAYAPATERFALEDAEQRGDVTVIRRARERTSGKFFGIERPIPALQEESESGAIFHALADSRSQLRHPHILEHFDSARDDESAYGVVEWAAGGTLAERLVKRGPLGEHELLKVANSVASALEFATKRRVNHGGVLPENLCLTADGSVKVAGFGLEKLRAASRTGAYSRHGGAIDPASDVLDLCRTLYRLATAAERLERDRLERLPSWLHDLLYRGLSEEPKTRFRDADEFLQALRRFRDLSGGSSKDSASADTGLLTQTLGLAPTVAGEDPGSGSRGSGSRGTAGSGGSAGSAGSAGSKATKGSGSKGSGGASRKGTQDEFPWRPLFDDYEIDGAPRQGGMGAVYKAHEIATGRFVAIKRMKPGIQIDADAWRRFHREASNIAKLNHPHVLQLLQVGRDEEGDYLVLEWASGGSLLEKIQGPQGRGHGTGLPVKDVLQLARKIGSALEYAHAKGCIHRDIKPHNILISDSGEPKLADFGLARSGGDETLTSSGGGAGSLHYMAPEQGEDAHKADPRSDLFSLARTLYHAATGRKPIAVDVNAIPPVLRKPLLKCLNDNPDDRYPSVREFLNALDRSEAKSGRRTPILALTSVVAVVGALFAGKLILDSRDSRDARGNAVSETRDDVSRANLADPPFGTQTPANATNADPDKPSGPTQPHRDPDVVSTSLEPADAPVIGKPDPREKPPDPPNVEPTESPKPADLEKPKPSPEPAPEIVPKPPIVEPERVEPIPEKPDPSKTEPPPNLAIEPDPAVVQRLGDALDAAAAWDSGWNDATDARVDGARALVENDDRRAGKLALDRARQSKDDGKLDEALELAETAATKLRNGFCSATVAFLQSQLEPLLALASPTGEEVARADQLCSELRDRYVPEFLPAADHAAYASRIDAWKADPWTAAIQAISRAPAYGGLMLKRQDGLTPLRLDVASGLFEFTVDGTGTPPAFSGNGDYEIAADTAIVLVLVPGGGYRMGASVRPAAVISDVVLNFDRTAMKNELPEHDVFLLPFFLAKYELTVPQYERLGGKSNPLPSGVDPARSPAFGMTWADAIARLGAKGLELPTEAQWEYACRAGTHTPWSSGETVESLTGAAHLRFPSPPADRPVNQPLPIGSLAPNAFGMFDMMGNLAEYCADPWPGDHAKAIHRPGDGMRIDNGLDPRSSYRVFRGASYENGPEQARCSARDFIPFDTITMKRAVIGLRPALRLQGR